MAQNPVYRRRRVGLPGNIEGRRNAYGFAGGASHLGELAFREFDSPWQRGPRTAEGSRVLNDRANRSNMTYRSDRSY